METNKFRRRNGKVMRERRTNVEPRNIGYVLKRLKESWQWYLLLLPGLIHLLIFSYGPMYGVQIAFKNYRASRGIWNSEWVGFDHFIKFFKHPNFWEMIENTLSITLYSLAVFPLAILFALLLNEIRNQKFKKTVQMITYMPHFLTEVVVCSLTILFLERTNGPINNLIDFLGGERQNFMAMTEAFPHIYVWGELWQNIGWNAILYISALAAISPELVEAATIDGASRFQIMRHINIPGILPTVIITLLLRVGSVMSLGYSRILLLQNDLNREASLVISAYTYEIGILGGQYSYSSAIGLFNNLVNITVLLIVNAVVKKVTDTGLF